MIVTDGGFNDAAIRRELDLKYPSIMKTPDPIGIVFKDKEKIDMQNPIIGSLASQVQESKTNEKPIFNQISDAPTTKDIELAEHLAKLRGENNKYNFPPFLPPPPLPPTPPPSPPDGGDAESEDDDNDDDGNRNLAQTQRFLWDQPQRTAVAVGTNNTAMSMLLQEKKLDFLDFLKILAKYFLKQMIYLNQIMRQK